MAEAEDVIIDAARHIFVFSRGIWHADHPQVAPETAMLATVSHRLQLLIAAVFGNAFPLRVSQPPAPPSLLQRLHKHRFGPMHSHAIPATDGQSIWLPGRLVMENHERSLELYRVLALQQAMRAIRGGIFLLNAEHPAVVHDTFLLLEAAAADYALMDSLPGMAAPLNALRQMALARRPPIQRLPPQRRHLELLACSILSTDCRQSTNGIDIQAAPEMQYRHAKALAISASEQNVFEAKKSLLFKDLWTGEFRSPPLGKTALNPIDDVPNEDKKPPRSARLSRQPRVREPVPEVETQRQGAWMIQTSAPHEHAEDPIGMQRPTDRDESMAAEEFADSLSELAEARLVSTPGRAKEVLLSDDAPHSQGKMHVALPHSAFIHYPEWDYRTQCYRDPGAFIQVQAISPGPEQWVNQTLAQHSALLTAIRRRFDMLRAHRATLRQQLDGDEIDLPALIDGYADFRAGLTLPQGIYQTMRPARRDIAIALLIDISGSTDSWVSAHRRIIDVEREALLLVCEALNDLKDAYAVLGFSGEGPHHVTIHPIKDFNESYDQNISLRIAGLEPERYTRVGAALRHATALLMRQTAHHRLLLLLSDGKPNDIDEYEGRYGIEDMRRAVIEARWQGISPFCLTIDRLAPAYLAQVFGSHHYALLPRPELLSTALLDWMRKLIMA